MTTRYRIQYRLAYCTYASEGTCRLAYCTYASEGTCRLAYLDQPKLSSETYDNATEAALAALKQINYILSGFPSLCSYRQSERGTSLRHLAGSLLFEVLPCTDERA